MVEVLVPADAENALRLALAGAGVRAGLGVVHVGTRIPDKLPPAFIRVRAVGGAEATMVTDTHTLTVEAYSTREADAQRLCAVAAGIAASCARSGVMGNTVCYTAAVVGLPANLPDPTTPLHKRFTATVSVSLRRERV